MTEDEMVGWLHSLDGHEFEQAPGVGDRQGSQGRCSPWSLLTLASLLFSALCKAPQTTILPFCISFSWDGLDHCLLIKIDTLNYLHLN